MSTVTNLILATGFESAINTELINAYFKGGMGFRLCSGGAEECELEVEGSLWYGGSKFMEGTLYAGAFNYLDLAALKQYLGGLSWQYRGQVQLIIKEQESDHWHVETLKAKSQGWIK